MSAPDASQKPTVGAKRAEPLVPPRPLFFSVPRSDDAHDPIDPFQTPNGSVRDLRAPISGTATPYSEDAASPPQTPGAVPRVQSSSSVGFVFGAQREGASYLYPAPDITSRSSGIVSLRGSAVDLPGHARDRSVTSGLSTLASRPGTTSSAGGIEETDRPDVHRRFTTGPRQAFAAPPPRPMTLYTSASYNASAADSSTIDGAKIAPNVPAPSKRLKSTMLTGPIEKPWTEEKDKLKRAAYWITYAVMLLGVAGSVVRCYFGWKQVPRITKPLCLVLDDNFDTFDTENVWTHEVDLGGFGNGEFEMATASPNNSFVEDGLLYLMPTLTSDVIGTSAIFDGYTYNLTGCTNVNQTACGAVSNHTAGTVINPVMSARITTQKTRSIRFGRVEVRAKNPKGDWLWPAIWMLPKDNTYGPWPMSGEIDLMESRGNGPKYKNQGNNYVRGSLNWGPTTWINGMWRTSGFWTERRKSYDDGFHTYVLEWTEDFIRIYVDTRLHHMLDLRFNEPFFKRGKFPSTITNGTQQIVLENPWVNGVTVPNAAPFDQQFYLIMDVAVGGTNGWFPDNVGDKPWLDGSNNAMRDFASSQSEWYKTWPQGSNVKDRALVVDYVKMWEEC